MKQKRLHTRAESEDVVKNDIFRVGMLEIGVGGSEVAIHVA
jgi:hypothetical protein